MAKIGMVGYKRDGWLRDWVAKEGWMAKREGWLKEGWVAKIGMGG